MAGRSYYFVFCYHVPLFFFVSGCMETFCKEDNFFKYLIKKIKSILIPFWVFAAMSGSVAIIYEECTWERVKGFIVEVLRGVVRNTYIAGGLWFLTCLFVMQILFFIIKKIRYKSVILLAVVLCYLASVHLIEPSPAAMPRMYYNVDSALYYMIYYAIGYVVFPYILEVFDLDTKKKKAIFGMDWFAFLRGASWSNEIVSILSPCIMIYAFFVIARWIEDIPVLADVGKNTLYLCGSEYMIRVIFVETMAIFGLSATIPGPVGGYVYTAFLLFVANKYLVPVEKYIINKIVR